MTKMDTEFTNSNKLLCIVGPTATGKTDIALELAKLLNAEVLSCDSRQVYKGLDLGTGKEPGEKFSVSKFENYWIINGVKIWMYDVASPEEQYSVSNYIQDSKKLFPSCGNKISYRLWLEELGFICRDCWMVMTLHLFLQMS